MLAACSWGSSSQRSLTIESWNRIKKVYVTSRQQGKKRRIERERKVGGFEKKKNISAITEGLVTQWEFRWRINWQISSQLLLFGPREDRWDFVIVYNQNVAPFSTNGKQSLRYLSEISSGVSLDARLRFLLRLVRRWCSWIIVKVLDYWSFLFSSFIFLESTFKGILFFHLIILRCGHLDTCFNISSSNTSILFLSR